MTKDVYISVTPKDISKGCRNLPQNCPVAYAVRRRLKTDRIFVDKNSLDIYVNDWPDKDYYTVMLNDRVRLRIKHFDETGVMHPFKFKLKVRT